MTKTKTRLLTVGLAFIVLLAAALFVIPSLGTTANAEAWDGTTIASDFAGGSGTETEPHLIANGEQLAYLAYQINRGVDYTGAYFELTADIDLGGNKWTPIGSDNYAFWGIFNGNGYTISNINPTVIDSYTGLFGKNSGTIRNVYLDGVDVVYTEGYGAAALCSKNSEDGIIEGCAVLGGKIYSSNPDPDTSGKAAGICAKNFGKINKCYNMAAITTQGIGAGIVYFNDTDGTVSNCYNAGEVSGTSDASGEIGGICSENYGKIEYCLNYGEVKNAKTVGGICASNYNGQSTSTSEYSTINSCYTDSDVCSADPIGYDGGGRQSDVGKKTTEDLCNFEGLSGFDSGIWDKGIYDATSTSSAKPRFGKLKVRYTGLIGVGSVDNKFYDVYDFSIGDDYDWQEYTLITTEDEFLAIGKDESKWHENYVLGANLDLTGKDVTPIGNATAFDGKFSGDGHTISGVGVKVSVTGNDPAGLFGGSTGVIMNLAVEGEISGNNAVGGICGQSDGTIFACSFNGTVTGKGSYIGGICGYNYKKIVNCFSAADVMGSDQVGGICGYNASNATVSDTVSVCTVSGSGNLVAAVCGKNDGTLTENYFDKDVSGITVGAKDGDNNELSDGTIGWTTEELCTIMPGIDYTIWSDGSKITEVDKNNARKHTVTYTYPSLTDIETAYSFEVKEYNFSTGDSPDWQPYTEISTPKEYNEITKIYNDVNGNYVLTGNIDFGGNKIDPIGIFKGKFSGDGFTISNFTINENVVAGLFDYNYGLIMNLAVDGNISGAENVGGICGNNEGTIYACSFEGSVNGATSVGGISGANNGTISNCYAICAIEATGNYAAGISGDAYDDSTIESCYFSGTISTGGYSGVLIGAVCANEYGIVTNCYYNKDLYTADDTTRGTGKTTAELCDKDALDTLNLDKSIWQAGKITSKADPDHPNNARMRVVNADYLSLIGVGEPHSLGEEKQYNFKTNGNDDWQEYTEINSPDDLANMSIDGSYVLMNDIPLGNFTTIGSQDAPFTGKFSGNGHMLSGVTISANGDYAGIFGVNEGTIMNLAVEGDITGSGNNVGSICGYNNGTVYACSFKGSVKGAENVGGICGYNSGTISNCYAMGAVEATVDYSGGICGKNQAGIKIEYCYFAGTSKCAANYFAICCGGSNNCYYDRELFYVDDSDLGAVTTERLCSLPERFNGDIWEKGSFTVTSTDGKFRTVSFTYPRLKEGCEAYKVDDVKQYNFKTDGKDYWARFKEIKTLTDLENVNNNTNANYVMMNDIDLNGAAFTPISINYGKFSGDGHTIKNGKIAGGNYTGLFVDNRGFIMNLAVKCDVSGRDGVGGICAFNYGTVYGCSFEGSVTGSKYVGGICGYMSGGESHINNCYVIGTIEAANTLAGGISGSTRGAENNGYWDFAPPRIENCYFVGTVTVPENAQKDAITVKTSADTYELTVENCYYNSELYTDSTTYGTGLTTVEMTSSDALNKMTGFDSNVWEKTANKLVDSDGENGVAYYPSIKGSKHIPSVEFTASLTFERTDDKALAFLDEFEIKYGGEIKFANGATVKLDNANCDLSAVDDVDDNYIYIINFDNVTSDTFTTTVMGAGEITYTFTCPPRTTYKLNEYLPSEGLTKSFSIDAAKYTLSADDFEVELPTDPVYNGKPWTAVGKKTDDGRLSYLGGYGDITVKYYDKKTGKEAEPINAGDYLVKLDVSEGERCYEATGLTADGNIWSFTIEQADYYSAAVNVTYNWATTGEQFVCVTVPTDMGTLDKIYDAEISCDDSIISAAHYEDGKVYFTFSDANTEQDINKMALVECQIDSQNYEPITAMVYVTLNGLANQEAPSADDFALVLNSYGSDITVEIKTDLEGVEFSFEGVDWRPWSSTDARHDELIIGFIRYAATSTHNASAPVFKSVRSGHGNLSANHYDRVEPTCVDDGNIEYWECEQCDKKFSDAEGLNEVKTVVLDKLGHKPSAAVEENRVEATCTVDGSYDEVVYCSVCEEELSRNTHTIPANGHDWATEWSTDEHDHWHKCVNCDEIKDKAAHVSSGAATETTPETCTVCGYVIAPELGHIHANHLTEVPTKAATCTKDGNRQYFICDCGKLFADSAAKTEITPADVTIKAEGHKFGDWVTTKEPTRTSTGIKMRTCSVCGATEEDTIPKKSGGSSGGGSSGGYTGGNSGTADDKPSVNGVEKSWAEIAADIAKLPAGSTVVINLNGETAVPSDVIRAIKDSKAKVEFVIDSTRSWIVDGAKITAVSAADFSILPGNADRSALRGVLGANMKIAGTGVPADLKLTFRKEFAGQFANLYKLTDGKLVFQSCAKVDENGAAIISGADAKGEYIVMVCEFSDRPGDMNNDGVMNALDAATILQEIVGIARGANPLMGDFNGDGIVNALDAAAILKAIVGIAA